MSIQLTDTNGARLVPASSVGNGITGFPFAISCWVKEDSASPKTDREWIRLLQGSGALNRMELTLVNARATTPATHTSIETEAKQVGTGDLFDPNFNSDPIEMDTWVNVIMEWEDSSTQRLYIGNVEDTNITGARTTNPFNDSGNYLASWIFFGRYPSAQPNTAKFAALVVADRQFTATEKSNLQSYLPSSISTLSDCWAWDLDDAFTAGHGGVDLEEASGSSLYTFYGADNPSLTAQTGGTVKLSSSGGLLRTSSGGLHRS